MRSFELLNEERVRGRENKPAAMNKLDRKISHGSSSSSSSLTKEAKGKKKSSPRKPLKDLNSTCVDARISAEARRGGGRCFSFFTSNSSSSKPQSRTPTTVPHNIRAIPAKNPKRSSNPSLENPRFQASSISLKPKRNRSRPNSKDPILGSGHTSEGKSPNPSLNFGDNLKKNGLLGSNIESSSKNENSNPNIKFEVGWVEMPSGSCLNSTPEKTFMGFSHEMDLNTKERERLLSNTPNSNNTPPIQASISPEMACGSSVDPTPVCFAAGHLITGVQDRRKCRPRGILTVGDNADASIQWLSSPSEKMSGNSSKFSKHEFVGPKATPFRIRDSSDHGFWRFSPENFNNSRSPKFEGLLGIKSLDFETTPSSGNDNRRTPTSNSSISPFSAIVRRTEESASGFKVLKPDQERREYRYGNAIDCTPISEDSLSSYNSREKEILNPFYLDSVADSFGNMQLSPKNGASDILPPFNLSFQYLSPQTPSNSIDLTRFKKPNCEKNSPERELCSNDKDLYASELRVSWRDGLVSRIFEMGELDCCKYLSDEEEEKGEVNKFEAKNKSSVFNEENDEHICSFGSFEFPVGGISLQKSNLCAESISTNGGLVSSEDSDWTLFYKNQLYEG